VTLTPEEPAQLEEEHRAAVARQRRDREELAAKEAADEEWGEEIERRWGTR
jgi:hypothetical protein